MKKNNEIICRCEGLRRGDIEHSIDRGARSIAAVKRRTSAGMGFCHGRTCTKLVEKILIEKLRMPMGKPSFLPRMRPPVRPILTSDFEVKD